jgi:cytochrome c oxidase subunit II
MMRQSLQRCVVFALAMVVPTTAARSSPAGQAVHEVTIVASRFQFAPATIQVMAGEPVRLVIRSSEGSHGFAIPALEIDGHVAKNGEPLVIEFTAPAAGTYEIACSEFCGSGHSHMKAALVSVAGPVRNR